MNSYPSCDSSGFSQLEPIAYARTGFTQKFGIPRQSGRVNSLRARIEFTARFRSSQALRGLEGFSHLWLIWQFSEVVHSDRFVPLVRPPRLSGNVRMGVFATRSPFRPNRLGLSSVKLEEVVNGDLVVSGIDLLDGTPIYDIKPYIREDVHKDAKFGFTAKEKPTYEVVFPPAVQAALPADFLQTLADVLAEDPRPAYHRDPERVYGFTFSGFEVKFRVDGVVRVLQVREEKERNNRNIT